MQRTAILVLLALVSFASAGARADVIYNWVNLEPNPAGYVLNASLDINPSYWSMGGDMIAPPAVFVDSAGHDDTQGEYEPYFGIDALTASFAGTYVCDDTPYPCFNVKLTAFSAIPSGEPLFGGDGGDNSMVVDVLFVGTYLTGTIDEYSDFDGLEMSSNGNIWTINGAGNDGGGSCNLVASCGGGTGEWVLDLASLPVPEPATLALFGLGLAGLGLTRRNHNNERVS